MRVNVRQDRAYDLTVVGIARGNTLQPGSAFVPPDVLQGSSQFTLTILQVTEEDLNAALLNLSTNPLLFTIDISFIDGLLRRVIDQFSAIPTVVGLLSLLAAAVSMANTVSLATLERRRQIGILKAVGVKGPRVLWIMLVENTIVGLLGGLLGIGLSALGVGILTAVGQGEAVPIPREAQPIALALIGASVLIAWVATFLSARPITRERVTNVLRYD
jgi:ABC-type antimicrobial peptide transport system permease subunit